jgi:hypothetical protein
MNSEAPLEIERDLVRWSRAKWVTIVLLVLAVQGAILFSPTHSTAPGREIAQEPSLSFVPAAVTSLEIFTLDDPKLFAAANRRGFSGSAWMLKAERSDPTDSPAPAPQFLSLDRSFGTRATERAEQLIPIGHMRPLPEPTQGIGTTVEVNNRSDVVFEGASDRSLVSIPPLPVQFGTDAVRSSTVQVLIDPDGIVFTARLLTASGSRTADNDALTLSKKARFTPLSSGSAGFDQMTVGKLIFDWYTLDHGATNGLKK